MQDVVKDFEDACVRGLSEGMKQMLALAHQKSQGPFSLEEISTMGSYVTASGKMVTAGAFAKQKISAPALPAGIINKQTEDGFDASWFLGPLTTPSDGPEQSLINSDPVADYLVHGTKFMFQRPIDQEVEAAGVILIERALERELEKFMEIDYQF